MGLCGDKSTQKNRAKRLTSELELMMVKIRSFDAAECLDSPRGICGASRRGVQGRRCRIRRAGDPTGRPARGIAEVAPEARYLERTGTDHLTGRLGLNLPQFCAPSTPRAETRGHQGATALDAVEADVQYSRAVDVCQKPHGRSNEGRDDGSLDPINGRQGVDRCR
jgi:hypothetical protein